MAWHGDCPWLRDCPLSGCQKRVLLPMSLTAESLKVYIAVQMHSSTLPIRICLFSSGYGASISRRSGSAHSALAFSRLMPWFIWLLVFFNGSHSKFIIDEYILFRKLQQIMSVPSLMPIQVNYPESYTENYPDNYPENYPEKRNENSCNLER